MQALSQLRNAVGFIRRRDLAKGWLTMAQYTTERMEAMSRLDQATRALMREEKAKGFRQWCEGVEGIRLEIAIQRTLHTLCRRHSRRPR